MSSKVVSIFFYENGAHHASIPQKVQGNKSELEKSINKIDKFFFYKNKL